VHALILVLDVAVVALAARVNIFQEFFFMADIFPLALSIITLVLLLVTLVVDFSGMNSYFTRPLFETGFLFTLSVLWLASNAFSTSRWRGIPMACSSIPADYASERAWCQDVQALKALIWILFVSLFVIAAFTLRYVLVESRRGRSHVWDAPLSRYNARAATPSIWDSDALRSGRATMTDYFGKEELPYLKF